QYKQIKQLKLAIQKASIKSTVDYNKYTKQVKTVLNKQDKQALNKSLRALKKKIDHYQAEQLKKEQAAKEKKAQQQASSSKQQVVTSTPSSQGDNSSNAGSGAKNSNSSTSKGGSSSTTSKATSKPSSGKNNSNNKYMDRVNGALGQINKGNMDPIKSGDLGDGHSYNEYDIKP
ncbi:hypothetical protein KYX44_000619, partial [Listeria monocytogenes]|nr:hypothetical protein [Listeria monocytogenes]